jgi:hypothetical protein
VITSHLGHIRLFRLMKRNISTESFPKKLPGQIISVVTVISHRSLEIDLIQRNTMLTHGLKSESDVLADSSWSQHLHRSSKFAAGLQEQMTVLLKQAPSWATLLSYHWGLIHQPFKAVLLTAGLCHSSRDCGHPPWSCVPPPPLPQIPVALGPSSDQDDCSRAHLHFPADRFPSS